MRFLPAGDTALVAEFGDTVDRALNDRVLALKRAIEGARIPGVIETVPTFRSLLVYYDPLLTSGDALEAAIKALPMTKASVRRTCRLWHLPVCYEQEFAPDLEEVCRRSRLGRDELIALHGGHDFHIYMIGFAPGFLYMGDLPSKLRLPRRADPRVRVPAGSVAIAGQLTAIYPAESPGGWHLIGRCPVRLFDPGWPKPALLEAGDAVRFQKISAADYAALEKDVRSGAYEPRHEDIRA